MRRKTVGSPASAWPTWPPSVRLRLPDTTSRQTARTRRTRWAVAIPSCSHPHWASLGLVLLDPADGHLVQMAHEDLLIAERKVLHDVVFQCRLRAAQHPGVLQRELLEHHRRDFMLDALAYRPRRMKCVVG